MNPITMNLVADDIIRFALREDMNAGDLSTCLLYTSPGILVVCRGLPSDGPLC